MKHLLLLILLIISHASVAKVVPVEAFAKQSLFNSLKLSPDGKHIAATVPKGNTTNLVIIDKATMKPLKAFSFAEFEHIGSFYWAGNKRVVYSKMYQKSDKEKKWQEIDKNNPIIDYSPLWVNFDRTKLYLSKNLNKSGASALYQYDFASKNIELLFNHPNLDIKS